MDRIDSGLVKWCPRQNHESFMHINLQHRTVQIYKPTGRATRGAFDYQPVSKYEDIPPLTTYDWSHTSPGLLAVGTAAGVVNLLRVDDNSNDYVELGVKMMRTCQAVAFNSQCRLAVGMDRVRSDFCLHIWDLGHLTRLDSRISGFQKDHSAFTEPSNRLEASQSISSIRFFEDQHNTLVVGIKGHGVKMLDLRVSEKKEPGVMFNTKCNNNLAIDSCDQNYFASSALDLPGIMIWDRRAANKPLQSTVYAKAIEDEVVPYGAALKLDRIVNVDADASITDSMHSDIRSLRFCRDRRGLLGVLSRTGQLKVLQINKERSTEIGGPPAQNPAAAAAALAAASSGPAYCRESAELLEVHRSHDMDVSRYNLSRKNDRIVSFDWVSLQNPTLRPRILALRASGKFDILEQPSNAADHMFQLVPWSAPHRGYETQEPYHDLMKFDAKDVPTMLGPVIQEQEMSKVPVFGPERDQLNRISKMVVTPADASKTALVDVDLLAQPLPQAFEEAEKVAEKLKLLRIYSRENYVSSKATLAEKEKAKQRANGMLSHRELHEELLMTLKKTRGFPREAHMVIDHTMLLRANEKYLFNPVRNAEIVSDDPWLRGMWLWIADAKSASAHTDMSIHPLDLSYMGISAVWNNDLGLKPHSRIRLGGSVSSDRMVWEKHIGALCKKAGLPRYDGIKTRWPNHRQLCLAICNYGEHGHEDLDNLHEVLPDVPTTPQTRAAAKALFRGKNQEAIDILKHAGSKHPTLMFVSLALQLMGKEGTRSSIGSGRAGVPLDFDDSVACKTDPYLRAISTLIATGDWRMVAAQKSLPLADRAYVAVRNLDDTELTTWLSLEVGASADEGDLEGIVLTGLTGKLIDIFARYIAKFGDYQTATLVCAMFAPRYVDDFRAHAWRTAYRDYLQRHRAFLQRTKYDVESTKLSKRDGNSKPQLKPPPRQIALRCVLCDQPQKMDESRSSQPSGLHRGLSTSSSTPSFSINSKPGAGGPGNQSAFNGGGGLSGSGGSGNPAPETQNPLTAASMAEGLSCNKCGRNLPRCAVCLEIVGMKRSTRIDGAVDAAVKAAAKFPCFCLKCEHVMHLNHAREWFARMTECAVPECKCQCNFRANPELMY